MITSTVPDHWRSLQREVGRILSECGFLVEVEKKVKNVRETVELDVYAEEELNGRKYSIVCECKNWKTRVPQTVVHSFRTVLTDLGANLGYIVSLAGFQNGALHASDSTNVKLVTWEEFQHEFEESWLKTFFTPSLSKYQYRYDLPRGDDEIASELWLDNVKKKDREYFEHLKRKKEELGDFLSDGDNERFTVIVDQCCAFNWIIDCLAEIAIADREGESPTLPLFRSLRENSPGFWVAPHIPQQILEAVSFRECLEETISFGDEVIAKFRDFRPDEA